MLKFQVTNMSCGHCRLKIEATLNDENFRVKNIDMDKNLVNIEATMRDKTDVTKLLDGIGYLVDQDSFLEINERLIHSSKLEDEALFNKILSYIDEQGYVIEDIKEDFSIVILCTMGEWNKVNRFLEEL